MISADYAMTKPLKKRYRKLPVRGLGACPELVEGCPPNLKIPQDWGTKGVDVDYFSTLYDESLPEGE
jgi:hypothetical protein